MFSRFTYIIRINYITLIATFVLEEISKALKTLPYEPSPIYLINSKPRS